MRQSVFFSSDWRNLREKILLISSSRRSSSRGMDDRGGGGGGSFVAVRRISQGLDRGSACHSTSGIFLFLYFSFSVRYLAFLYLSFHCLPNFVSTFWSRSLCVCVCAYFFVCFLRGECLASSGLYWKEDYVN